MITAATSCDKDNGGGEYPTSNWGQPQWVIEYEDTAGAKIWESTTYYYDHHRRLMGYRKVDWNGNTCREMVSDKFNDNVHTYDIHDYEWVGATLPVIFHYTDTYTDAKHSTLITRRMEAESMDWQETITYRYEDDGRLAGYRTVMTGQYPADFDTRVIYIIDPRPSATAFPHDVEDEDNRVEIVYTDSNGNRTGYYSDNDYSRAQWNFDYDNGSCTYYTSRWGEIDTPHLVHVIFLPDRE